MGGLSIGRVAVVSDPAAIRHVLLENCANYEKDWLQRPVLSAGLSDGLLTAGEGGQWRARRRRALAPLFARKAVANFSAAMAGAAEALVERLAAREDEVVNLAVEATRITLEILSIRSSPMGSAGSPRKCALR